MRDAIPSILLVACLMSGQAAPAGAQGKLCGGDPPMMLIVMDRSGSMYGSNWSAAQAAVTALTGAFPGWFGLMLFPSNSGCGAGKVDVPVGPASAKIIVSTLAATSLTGSTPMTTSLQAAGTYLAGLPAKKQRSVLLITDGCDTCSGNPVTAVAALKAAGAKTYVVGFGSGVCASTLSQMAVAAAPPSPRAPSTSRPTTAPSSWRRS